MNIVSINGSRRKKGNTEILIQSIIKPFRKSGEQVESIFLGDYEIDACTGCEGCRSSWTCVIQDDFSTIVRKMDEANIVVLASPTYWYTVTSDMKRFIDRCYSLIQFPESRSEWIGKYDGQGKACITVAVCEQHEEKNMGNTLSLLTDFARDIGLEVSSSIKALGCFEAGSILNNKTVLSQAEAAGHDLLNKLSQ